MEYKGKTQTEIIEMLASRLAGLTLENGTLRNENAALKAYIREELIAQKTQIEELQQKLEDAKKDPLSGILMRRALEELQPLPIGTSYVMCDIDNFRQFNNEISHEAGDETIRIIGEAIRKIIAPAIREILPRKSDYAIRYGGDEFLLIFPLCSSEVATKKCEELAEIIRSKEISGRKVTMSFGIYYNEDKKDLSPLDAAHFADMALKRSKESGKNQISVYYGEEEGKSYGS